MKKDRKNIISEIVTNFQDKLDQLREKYGNTTLIAYYPEFDKIEAVKKFDVSKLKGDKGLKELFEYVLDSETLKSIIKSHNAKNIDELIQKNSYYKILLDLVTFPKFSLIEEDFEINTQLLPSQKIELVKKKLDLKDSEKLTDAKTNDRLRVLIKQVRDETWLKRYTDLSRGIYENFSKVGNPEKEITNLISNANAANITGKVFEYATAKIFNQLISEKFKRNDGVYLNKIIPNLDPDNILVVTPHKQGDGVIKITKKDEDGKEENYIYIYDCKSTKKIFVPGNHIETALLYINNEKHINYGAKIGGFIYFAPNYTPPKSIRENAQTQIDKGINFILIKATDLKEFIENIQSWNNSNRNIIKEGISLIDFVDWKNILFPTGGVGTFGEKAFNDVIKNAQRDADKFMKYR